MKPLLDPRATPTRREPAVLPSPIGTAVFAAGQAAGASLVLVLAPVVLSWVTSGSAVGAASTAGSAPGAAGQITWLDAVRLALTLWLLGQHTGLTVPGGHVGLVPLGLTALPLVASWFAGRRMARVLDPLAERIAAGASRARPRRPPWTALLAFVGCYTTITTGACLLAVAPGVQPITEQAALGAVLISGIGGGFGAACYRFGGVRGAIRGVGSALRALPAPGLVRWLRAASAAVGVQLGLSVVVLVVLLISGGDRVLALHHALDPGAVGGAVLVFGQLLLAPNLVIWVAAVLAGPGVALGSGTSVTLVSCTLGPLPAIPVLAALPAPGAMPGGARALLAVPVLAGLLAGWLTVKPRERGLAACLGDAAAAALLSGLVFGGLAWLSGGPGGAGRLGQIGPNAMLCAAAFGAEVLVGAMISTIVVSVTRRIGGPAEPAHETGRDTDTDREPGPATTVAAGTRP